MAARQQSLPIAHTKDCGIALNDSEDLSSLRDICALLMTFLEVDQTLVVNTYIPPTRSDQLGLNPVWIKHKYKKNKQKFKRAGGPRMPVVQAH